MLGLLVFDVLGLIRTGLMAWIDRTTTVRRPSGRRQINVHHGRHRRTHG